MTRTVYKVMMVEDDGTLQEGWQELPVTPPTSEPAPVAGAWVHEDVTELVKFRYQHVDEPVYLGRESSAASPLYSVGFHRLGDMGYLDAYVRFGDGMVEDVYRDGAPHGAALTWGWVFMPQVERLRPSAAGGLHQSVRLWRPGTGVADGFGAWERINPPTNQWAFVPRWIDVGIGDGRLHYDWPFLGRDDDPTGRGIWKVPGAYLRVVTALYRLSAP